MSMTILTRGMKIKKANQDKRVRSPSCPKTKIRNNKVNSQISDFLQWKKKLWTRMDEGKKCFFYKKECLMNIDVSATRIRNMVKEKILKVSLYNLFRRMVNSIYMLWW